MLGAMSADRAQSAVVVFLDEVDPFLALHAQQGEAEDHHERSGEAEPVHVLDDADDTENEELEWYHQADNQYWPDEEEVEEEVETGVEELEAEFGVEAGVGEFEEDDLGQWGSALKTVAPSYVDNQMAKRQKVGGEQEGGPSSATLRRMLATIWSDPSSLEAESEAAKKFKIAWKDRGPRVGPEDGGPETWRNQPWRKTTQKWAKRGGRNLRYWSELYSKKSKEGKGPSATSSSSSSSSVSWQPNLLGKGHSKDDPDGSKNFMGRGGKASGR